MEQIFITRLDIHKVRHLENISIPLSETERKHLILTGKNGSGKTSVIDALHECIDSVLEVDNLIPTSYGIRDASFECNHVLLKRRYDAGRFIVASYGAERIADVEIASNIEQISLKKKYSINETPGEKLVKYMVAKKATQAFAGQQGFEDRVKEIDDWFVRFENILKRVFDDPGMKLEFNIDSFRFFIRQPDREPFDFNTMSSGYSAVFDIINDLIMRMEGKEGTVEGIVLIDEIETHLHLELQKNILPILTELFPNIQFIVTTHSPFILNSIDNTVIYDLENHTLVENGMANLPYEGVVESYFHTNRLSKEYEEKLNRYTTLVNKQDLTNAEYAEIMELEIVLDEIPDFLSPDIAAKYSRLKQEFESREV